MIYGFKMDKNKGIYVEQVALLEVHLSLVEQKQHTETLKHTKNEWGEPDFYSSPGKRTFQVCCEMSSEMRWWFWGELSV